jgi:hypothetical protein
MRFRLCLLVVFALALVGGALAAPTVKLRTIEKSRPKVYDAHVEVLQIQSPSPAQSRVNLALMRDAAKHVAELQKEAAEGHQSGAVPYDLTIRTHKHYLSGRWLSLTNTGGIFLGGAHPSPIYESHLFDLATGREVALGDLFRPATPWMKTLGAKCQARLEPKMEALMSDAEWIKRGTAAEKDNYQVFYIDGRNLVIVFPAYQVAPYASGPQEIKLPYAELSSIANPKGPLALP